MFTAVGPDRFATFAEPDFVEMVWTLKAEPVEATHTRVYILPTWLEAEGAACRPD